MKLSSRVIVERACAHKNGQCFEEIGGAMAVGGLVVTENGDVISD